MFAEDMSRLLEKTILDKELREWILPTFSTTTPHDTVIASILMMGAMQNYFDYFCTTRCGIPSVTLRGTKADWELIFTKLSKLTTWGKEPTQFSELLVPVVARFAQTFDTPDSPEIVDFWQRIVAENHQGSGVSYYSGWITAFCFWDKDGNSMYDLNKYSQAHRFSRSQPAANFSLDGIHYHKLDVNSVPPGWTSVPVNVDDNGYKFKATMVAGSVGINCTSSGEKHGQDGVGLDSMSPCAAWFMFERNEGKYLTRTGRLL